MADGIDVRTGARPGQLGLGLLLRTGELSGPYQGRVVGWSELRDMAQAAEAVGFDTLWVADHFIFRNSPPVNMAEGESRGVWECFTLLAALAEATSRATIGPFVACTGFRNPALLAKMSDTLDEVSAGRLLLGLGAGWHEPEYDAFGYPFDHRAGRFEEALRIIVPLLREGQVDFRGQYYEARDCELRPRGPRPGGPPIWIGAKGPRMMRLVARYADAYNTVWHGSPEELAEPFGNLEAACRDVDRDPSQIARTGGCFVALESAGDTGSSPPERTLSGSPEEVARRLDAFRAAGVGHMTVILDPWTVDGIQAFAPVLRALR
jgi:probable F420-dependent oxidoreductase